jgi:hypothetical protein
MKTRAKQSKPKKRREDEPIWIPSLEAASNETEIDENVLDSQRAAVLIRVATLFGLEVGDKLVIERTEKRAFQIVVIDDEDLVMEAASV